MPRYAISLDTDTVTETLDAHAFGVASRTDALMLLGIQAGVLFQNVEEVPATDAVRFAFDSTPDDVSAFVAHYEADPEFVELLG